MLKLNPTEVLDWVFNDAWVSIMVGTIVFLVFITLVYLGIHNFRELQRINDVFATILLCEEDIELPKAVALEVINGAFHSKITKDDLVVDIYENPERDNWVNLVVRNNDTDNSERVGLIATATEKNFGVIILKHLL